MTAATNALSAACEPVDPEAPGVRGARLLERPRGTRLVSAVWELDPGTASTQYHLHHATEELLLVLEGEPTLRTPEGERSLAPGEVAHFPAGAGGAHQVLNRTDGVVRYLMVAAHGALDVVEYVDEGRAIVYSHRASLLRPDGLFLSHDLSGET